MDNELIAHQFGSSVATVYLIQLLKSLDIPGLRWINDNTESINRAVGLLAAFAVSLGIGFASTGSFQAGGTVTITVPSAHDLFEGILHAAIQYGMQQGYFAAAVSKSGQVNIRELAQHVVLAAKSLPKP